MNQATVISNTPAARPQHSGVTELVLTKHSPDQVLLLLPMIAHLSQQADRWITWVAPGPIAREQLESFGVDTHKLRIIHSRSVAENNWILWDALNNGTSHTVIGEVDAMSEEDVRHLEAAAQQGNAKALLVRYR